MITGVVDANLEARVRLAVRGDHESSIEVDAIIDTGFTGFLTLPQTTIESLRLRWLGRAHAVLGDGLLHPFEIHVGVVRWDGRLRTVEVNAADTEPLVGMGMLRRHELRLHAVPGDSVNITQTSLP